MSEPFLAEVRIFPYNFAPRGWAECNGQLLPISQNTALFSLLGTTYGGDGRSTFGLPDLRGRGALHAGRGPGLSSRRLGETGGQRQVKLSETEMASHSHPVQATAAMGTSDSPTNRLFAASPKDPYATSGGSAMTPKAVSKKGGTNAHNNMPPYLTFNYCIALQGLYPSRD